MRRQGRVGAFAACLLSSALIATAVPAAAQPSPAASDRVGTALSPEALQERQQAPETAVTDAPTAGELGEAGLTSTSSLDDASATPAKPRNDVIVDVPVDETDASIPLNLIPYHEFPGLLRDLQGSDRVSVEIIGQSTQGRDLHMVVVTTMDDEDWVEWQRLSDLRTEDPVAAAAALEAGEYDDWQVPIFINNNIHGNEWEGTDANFQLLDELAFSDDPEVLDYLDDHLTITVVSNNPDGRVNATRANAAGFDMNRDWAAQTQPEVHTVRDQLIRYNPVSMLDQHGYTGRTLIEPTTGPHGQNYEMDLYITHALRAAESMEDAIAALGEERAVTPIEIPYRDTADQWDGWPPVYTPMYAMQHGIIGHTVEFPLNPRGNLEEAERHERTRVNTAISLATMHGNLEYVHENRDEVLADQIEWYRRGAAGEPTRPITDEYALENAACRVVDGEIVHCNSKTYLQEFPRAWVIPAGEDQRSATAAVATVRYLLDNDVVVHEASTEVTIGGDTYPAGTFVVDMHQAKRGMAQNALETGRNLSDDWRAMYGDAAWSIGDLYGATLVDVDGDEELDTTGLSVIDAATIEGSVPAQAARFGLRIDSMYGVQAVNWLLEEGVELSRLPDGTFVAPGTARAQVEQVASLLGVSFTALGANTPRGAEPFDVRTIGVSATNDQATVLARLGFEVVPVNTAALNDGAVDLDDLDAMFIGSNAINPLDLDEDAAAAFADWLADGNALVGQGAGGALFNDRAELLPVTASNSGSNNNDGIAAVVNDPTSTITGDALEITFVRGARWFADADEAEGVRVDQRLVDDEGYFLAGHWPTFRNATGQPIVVSGVADGAHVTLFGSDPTARTHPQGLFPQLAEALWMPPVPAVDPIAPTADAGGDYTVELGDELTLDGSASISPDELPLTFTWDVSALGGTTLEGETVTVTPVETGEFEVELTVTDTNEPALSDSDTATVTVVDPPLAPITGCDDVDGVTFPDVGGPPHGANIACIAGFGIAQGNASGNYLPFADVRRDQMASFLERLLTVGGVELPAPAAERFPDVPNNSTHKGAIERLAEAGIVEGRVSGAYDPLDPVTRGQMATFLRRTLEFATGDSLAAPRSPFTDVPARYVHARGVDVTYDLGIAQGRTATTFVPNGAVQRDQMGSFLARTLEVMGDAGFELAPLD
jgi:hypothetical protein